MHVCQLTACVGLWLNDGFALCECCNGVKLQWLYAAAAAAVCVVPPPTAHAPTHTHRPSGLLMVLIMLTLTVEVWLYGMTCIEADPQSFIIKMQPKIVGLYASIVSITVAEEKSVTEILRCTEFCSFCWI